MVLWCRKMLANRRGQQWRRVRSCSLLFTKKRFPLPGGPARTYIRKLCLQRFGQKFWKNGLEKKSRKKFVGFCALLLNTFGFHNKEQANKRTKQVLNQNVIASQWLRRFSWFHCDESFCEFRWNLAARVQSISAKSVWAMALRDTRTRFWKAGTESLSPYTVACQEKGTRC